MAEDYLVLVEFLVSCKDGLEAAQTVSKMITDSGLQDVSIVRVSKSWK